MVKVYPGGKTNSSEGEEVVPTRASKRLARGTSSLSFGSGVSTADEASMYQALSSEAKAELDLAFNWLCVSIRGYADETVHESADSAWLHLCETLTPPYDSMPSSVRLELEDYAASVDSDIGSQTLVEYLGDQFAILLDNVRCGK